MYFIDFGKESFLGNTKFELIKVQSNVFMIKKQENLLEIMSLCNEQLKICDSQPSYDQFLIENANIQNKKALAAESRDEFSQLKMENTILFCDFKRQEDTTAFYKSQFEGLKSDVKIHKFKKVDGKYNKVEKDYSWTYYPYPENVDNQFIGSGMGNLYEWSVKRQTIVRCYKDLMDYGISSMAISTNKKQLFVSGYDGLLKRITLGQFPKVEDFRKEKMAVWSIACGKEDRFLFTSGKEKAELKQISISTKTKVYDYTKEIKNSTINCLLVTHDNEFLFVAGKKTLDQIHIRSRNKVETFYHVGTNLICMTVDRYNKNLYVGDIDGTITIIKIRKYNRKKQHKEIGAYPMRSILVTGDGKKLFVASGQKRGTLKIIDTKKFSVLRDFGPIHENVIYHMVFSMKENTLITSCMSGYLKEWSLKKNYKLIKDHGKIDLSGICSLCQ